MSQFNLPKLLAKAELIKHIPLGPNWFSQEALRTGELGKLIEVYSTQIGLWLGAVKDLRKTLYLGLASGEDLDEWGKDIKLLRRTGESDELYRNRIKTELLRLRVTRQAIVTFMEDLSGLSTKVITPWQYQDWRARRTPSLPHGEIDPFYGRSGQTRRTSSYYQSGVIDIVTDGFDPAIIFNAPEVVALGVKPYFTAEIKGPFLQYELTEGLGQSNTELGYEVLSLPIEPTNIRSGLLPRSGNIWIALANELTYGMLADQAYVIDEQRRDLVYQYDLWPPVRSVFTLGRSPRSGAFGEDSNFEDDPSMFGGVLVVGDDGFVAQDSELFNEYWAPVRYGAVRSIDLGRSGYDERLDMVVVDRENTADVQTVLFDHPELMDELSIYDAHYSWEDMDRFTWAQAIDVGHDALSPADVVVTTL